MGAKYLDGPQSDLWNRTALAFPNRSPSVHKVSMGSKRLDDIAAYRRHGYRLQVQCANCGHSTIHDPETLITLSHRRVWSRSMPQLEQRFRCKECGNRNVRCGPVSGLGDR
jgi:ribosomal protein S27E